MKKILLALLLVGIIAPKAHAEPAPGSFADLVEQLSPAVVNISTTQKVKGYEQLPEFQFMFPPGTSPEEMNKAIQEQQQRMQQPKQAERKATSLGSGFIIDSKGLVITNNHVVAEADEITITLHDDSKLKAKVIGRDTKLDIAVLKVESAKPLPALKFGDSDAVRVGDWILAIGNPYGLGGTVTAGIISARARDINVGPFDDFLQTDAAINRGNSGGPMFNMKGEVIGINSAIFSPNGANIGIGFALPANLAQPVIKQIIQFGKAKRAWLGVKIQTVTADIASSVGLKETKGAMVTSLLPDSPALKSGLQEGDVILKYNNTEIGAVKKLPRMVAESSIGETATIQIFRDGAIKNINVKLGEMQEDDLEKADKEEPAEATKLKAKSKALLGMKIAPIDPETRQKIRSTADYGLLVLAVDPNGAAAQRGIAAGVVILKANQKKLKTIGDLEKIIAEAKAQNRPTVLLLIANDNEAVFLAVPIN